MNILKCLTEAAWRQRLKLYNEPELKNLALHVIGLPLESLNFL